ncbi:MAG: hypothetical protein JSR69_16425 [Proteobacteria bacterium]|nr:hypothetical protein [Pseudomonadota bacterium]
MANEALRYVVLRGPQWSDGQPLWQIELSAPKLKRLEGEDLTRVVNQLEDRIFPLRMLQTDALVGPGGPDELFRRPHVVAMHVIGGHSKEPYESELIKAHSNADEHYLDRGYPKGFEEYRNASSSDLLQLYRTPEALSLVAPEAGGTLARSKRTVFAELRWKRRAPYVRRDMPTYWYTMGAAASGDLPSQGAGERGDAQFQHVIAEPLLAPGEDWPGKDADIRLPAFGLLAGAVSLAVAHGGLPWLGTLQPTAPPRRGPLKISRYPVRLVPDGIELRTSVNFLGRGALEGWFHLGIGHEAEEEFLVLTLLPERTREASTPERDLLGAWQAAWKAAMPAPGTEEALQGFRVAADFSTVPSLRWRIPALKGAAAPEDDLVPGNSTLWGPKIDADLGSLPVDIPASAMRVELLSPAGPGGVDGVVTTGGGYFRLGTKVAMQTNLPSAGATDRRFETWREKAAKNSLILCWASPAQKQRPQSFWMVDSRDSESDVRLENEGSEAYLCAYNPTLLAERLRQIYGMSAPGTDGDDRELLPAFVPLRDGWLQVQVPNVPPDDPTKDGLDATALARARQNVLSGFLRFGNASQLPPLYSAYEKLPPRMVAEAPWLVTLEAAERLRIAIEIGKAPLSGLAVTDNPELSMRGLLWLSSDRPDALEAIPRLGAGPGAFIDVPLDRLDKETIQDSRRNLQIGLTKLSLHVDRQAVSRTGLHMSLALSEASGEHVVRWQRHPLMPLAAIMPLTRSARSAVRPLESRDLVPFIATKTVVGSLQPLADLTWQAGESLPRMQPGWNYELATEPAVMRDIPQPDDSTRCRLSWAAFGVPGCELVPRKGGDGPWDIVAASRFDLPVNDEAFATATLPPSMLSAEEQARLLAPPSVTALDWGALVAFWGEQQRLLQLSRVAHSYLAEFRSLGQTQPLDVDDLVGGRKWKLASLDFSVPGAGSALPYGAMLVGAETWSGNRALLGFSGRLGVTADSSLEPASVASPKTIDVVGYSPGSFLNGGFLRDARGVGTAPLEVLQGGLVRWRAIDSRAAELVGRMSLARPIDIASGPANLKLWFKDLPIDAQGNYIADAGRLSPAAWQDGELERRGVEWRLVARGDTKGFEMGDDTVPFFGLRLRPLRLESMQIEMDREQPATNLPLNVSLLAELILGPRKEDVGDGGNIVRIDMKRSDARLAIHSIQLFGQRVLHFPVSLVGDVEDAAREARLDVDVESIDWDEEVQEVVLKDVSLAFDFLGSRVTLKGVESVSAPGPVPGTMAIVFTWQGAAASPARLAMRRARLCVGASSQLRLRHELSIAPGGAPGLGAPVAVTAVEAWGSGGSDDWPTDLEPGCSVRVLNVSAPGRFTAGPRSFAVDSSAKAEDGISALLPGFPAGGAFEFGMLAAVGDFSDASVSLGAGSLSGAVEWSKVDPDQTLQLESIRFEAGNGLRGETPVGWQGRLLLSGDVVGTSSIAWPAIDLGTGASIPMPPVDTTITPVERVRGVWYRHTVTWLLRNHEMPFAVAAGLCERDDAVWSVVALARHKLMRVAERGDELEALVFSSVDTLTLAPMRVFAPPWPAGGRAADLQASSTFAARYVTGADNKPDPGMAWPGRGGVGSVLQGFGGEHFRKAFYAHGGASDGQSLVIVAGFLGLVTLPGVDAAPLLRLPTLVALEGTFRPTDGIPPIQQDADVSVKVAWVDGVAASDVVVPWRAAVTTVTAAHADLESAMDAGIRRPPPALRAERLFNAILVEQCFPVALDASHGLAHTPYFIASMVSLARVLAHVHERKTDQPDVSVASLSVLSRVSLVRASGKAHRKGAAAVLQASRGQTDSSPMPPRPPGRLLVVGDDLTSSPWLSGEVGTEADGRVATVATELHKRPRIALVRDAQGKHTPVGLPQRQLRPPVRRTPDLLYADVARGYMLEPEEDMLMAGAEEGWTGSLRDLASGIAAMGRVAALPAQARGGTGGGLAVWHTQQRVPIYLPIASTIQSEPIAWMDPSSARTRVPVEAEVNCALVRAVGAACEDATQDGAMERDRVMWQGIVPTRLLTTSVSDRAGVLFARSQRLETAARRADGGGYPFDEAFPSYGEPAQSSSAHARTERTPRPGILPVNTVDMERNRRPCASPLQANVNNRAVLGSADTVGGRTWWKYEGEGTVHGTTWSTKFVACPRTCGVISDPWDGTLDIAVEVDVLEEGAQASLPAYLAEFVLGANFKTRKVAASASIVVNGTKYPFASLHVRDFDVGPPPPLGTSMRRGCVTLVLDMRDVGTAATLPGPAYPALCAIRNAGPVPPAVEVQFTLHPKANAKVSVTPLPADVRFALDAEQAIPYGRDRAPVTLRFPLFAVTRERGAVPLEPATLLFMDPAYDDGLASQPVEAALRIPEKSSSAAMPRGRGDMRFVLSADRARVNRGASITFMADLSFERRLPAHLAELLKPGTGDIKTGSDDPDELKELGVNDPELLVLELQVQPRAGERREIFIASRGASAPTRCRLKLATVYELTLTSLVEADGSTARMLAGDVLELSVRKAPASGVGQAQDADVMLKVDVLDAAHLGGMGQWKPVTFDMTDRNLTLRLTLTDEPVIEPPPALYAALLRKRMEDKTSLSLPLYAQSPLPWRVDLPNAKADFRAGLLRRTATFVWSLLRPADEREQLGVFVVKCDRNGQTYLPDEASESEDFQAFVKLA